MLTGSWSEAVGCQIQLCQEHTHSDSHMLLHGLYILKQRLQHLHSCTCLVLLHQQDGLQHQGRLGRALYRGLSVSRGLRMMHVHVIQDNSVQCRAGQGRAGQGRAGQCRALECHSVQRNAVHDGQGPVQGPSTPV